MRRKKREDKIRFYRKYTPDAVGESSVRGVFYIFFSSESIRHRRCIVVVRDYKNENYVASRNEIMYYIAIQTNNNAIFVFKEQK